MSFVRIRTVEALLYVWSYQCLITHVFHIFSPTRIKVVIDDYTTVSNIFKLQATQARKTWRNATKVFTKTHQYVIYIYI